MDQADDELRVTIQHIWPLQAKKILDLLVPRNTVLNSGKLTVGKIYAGLLILESWRNTRFGQIDSGLPVSASCRKLSTTHTFLMNISSPQPLSRSYFTCCVLYLKTCIKSISGILGQGFGFQWESRQFETFAKSPFGLPPILGCI